MIDYLEIPSTPLDEKCVQVGEENYYAMSLVEVRVMKDFLLRKFGQPPAGAYFACKRVNHDFGSYPELRIYFDENDQEASKYAYDLDSNIPAQWDAVALRKLREAGYDMSLTINGERKPQHES